MKHRIADPEYLQQKVGVLLKTAESATELTRKLLTFSRRSVMNDSLVDISDVVSNFQSILNRFLGEDVVTRTAISRSSMLVRCDGAQIEQVLMNLVSNARDAMPGGGTLTISLERTERTSRNEALQLDPGEYAVLSVKDTGTGIPADVLDFIFEPFFSTKEERGTGLGLATVYGIVKQLGGAIEVQTEVGRGTEFILYFPISSVTTATLRTERPVPESPAAAGQGTILVVDDDPAVRQVIGQMLETLGYQSIEAESPQHALDFASENRPFDLALIDLVMPTIGGMELAVRLREKRPQLPILFMSGYSNKKLLESGVSDIDRVFIAKPFKRDFIAKKLNDLLIISSR